MEPSGEDALVAQGTFVTWALLSSIAPWPASQGFKNILPYRRMSCAAFPIDSAVDWYQRLTRCTSIVAQLRMCPGLIIKPVHYLEPFPQLWFIKADASSKDFPAEDPLLRIRGKLIRQRSRLLWRQLCAPYPLPLTGGNALLLMTGRSIPVSENSCC